MSVRTSVRFGYSEFDIWHQALPGVPLAVMSCYGSLDAPEFMPAGATKGTSIGAIIPKVFSRPDIYRTFNKQN
jgi:hypothetical protein